MKSKDIAIIIVIAVLAGIVSTIVGRFVFAKPADQHQKVEVVEAITTDFTTPDKKYFNSDSINPTQLIQIGNNTNAAPFNGSSQ